MFSRKSKAERTAEQAWDYLSSAMAAAGDTAGQTADAASRFAGKTADAASRFADSASKRADSASKQVGKASRKAQKASRKGRKLAAQGGSRLADTSSTLVDRAGATADEAWSRANAAADALAGRKPRTKWGLILGATAAGAAVGWLAAGALRVARERDAETQELEQAENAVIVTPAYDE